jgi:hypothetical protein
MEELENYKILKMEQLEKAKDIQLRMGSLFIDFHIPRSLNDIEANLDKNIYNAKAAFSMLEILDLLNKNIKELNKQIKIIKNG